MKFLHDMLRDEGAYCPVRVCLFAAGGFYHLGLVWMVCGQHVPIDASLLGTYVQHMTTLAGLCAAYAGVQSHLKRAAAPSQPS